MPRPTPDADDIVTSVRVLSLSLERWRAIFAHRHGLAPNDSAVLSHLSTAGGRLLPRELAALMDLRTGTLTSMLDRLERADFIRRVPNPDDRRSTFVELTDHGRETMADSFDLLTKHVRDGIPARVHARFAAYLNELNSVVVAFVDEIEERDHVDP